MSEELTARETLQIVSKICKENLCNVCPLNILMRGGHACIQQVAEHADEVIEICQEWKSNHAEIETEWVHVCRIIDGTANFGRCVYEREIDEDEILPFDTYDRIAEEILKEYAEKHEGKFFAMVERLCRRAVR